MTCICYSWVEVPFAEIGKCREGKSFGVLGGYPVISDMLRYLGGIYQVGS